MYSTFDEHDTLGDLPLQRPNFTQQATNENLPQIMLETWPTQTPTWRHHCHVVYIVDFTVHSQRARGDPSYTSRANRTRDHIESGLFVQTHAKRMCGHLYMPQKHPIYEYYVLQSQRLDNIRQHEYFESDAAIGFIFKKDYQNSFYQILREIQLPDKRNPEDSALYRRHDINVQSFPPENSTD
ncbi:hypothetical protein FOQG_09486 [Fusarium oxysporum f. sp. raphani 54005]|uniref:Uncharacterized protein n=2 Tax=Fusarium oxysporum f. sp. raphani TaxID=96318 RepID=X0C727_FUSOX|nr:hypothetical protein FOQG_09486 [Fusarium oxysporum f. sp. raphani 54005]KAJ4058551.1 hypothetical protein NW763_005973 [Fusarium oxysporum]KAJ4063374.1 hypothetical protein NW753_004826 [Fusarium oxysporum]KAJ4105111.1 hypothetical protein NW756_000879 [Fusarium oxysporum]